MAQTIRAIYRTSPTTFIVTKYLNIYRRHANNMLMWNFETSGTMKVGKRQVLQIDGVTTKIPCWTMTFSQSEDADTFIRTMGKAKKVDEALNDGGIAWLQPHFGG